MIGNVRTCALALLLSGIIVAFLEGAGGAVLVVDDDPGPWRQYDKIQDAINDAESGDIVRVYAGVYYENLVHNKSVLVMGNGSKRTRLHAVEQGFAIDFVSSGRFSRFNVTKSGIPMMPRLMGGNRIDNCTFHTDSIFIHYCGGFQIDNCTFWSTGLNFDGAGDCKVKNNVFHSSSIVGWGARNAFIAFNTMLGSTSGVGLSVESSNVVIWKNRLTGGNLGFADIDGGRIARNELTGGGLISVTGARVRIVDNQITGLGGIFLGGYQKDTLVNHTIEGNVLNDRPVRALFNRTGGSVSAGSGEVILINCSWIDVTDIDFEKSAYGLAVYLSDNITVSGCDFADGGNGVYLRVADNITISDCTFERNDEGVVNRGRSVHIEDCSFEGNRLNGISMTSGGWNRITGNDFDDNPTAIDMTYYCVDTTVDNNTIRGKNGTDDSAQSGIELWMGCNRVVIDNNTLIDTSGLVLSSVKDVLVRNNALRNDTPRRNGLRTSWSGIQIGAENITLTGNSLEGCGVFIDGGREGMWSTHSIDESNTVNGKPILYLVDQTDIVVPDYAGQVILAGCSNVMVEGMDLGNGTVGLELGFSDNCTVSGNSILNNSVSGIYAAFSENLTIEQNQVGDARYGAAMNFMYVLDTTVMNCSGSGSDMGIQLLMGDRFRVTDCDVRENLQVGIYCYASKRVRIDNCSIFDTAGDAIRCEMISESSIDCNDIRRSGGLGMNFRATKHSAIRDNEVLDGNATAVLFDFCENLSVIGNRVDGNSGTGLHLRYSSGSRVLENRIIGNGGFGIELARDVFGRNSTGNSVWTNRVLHNGNGTSQAYEDDGENMWDNGSHGNWWSDYNGTDSDGDGIGDVPYRIDGAGNATDRYPLGLFNDSYLWSVLYVDDDNAGDPLMNGSKAHPYDTVQRGIDNATLRTRVFVMEGRYPENVVVDADQIKIIGNGTAKTVVDGGGSGLVFAVTGNNVTLSRLGITGSGSGVGDAGIRAADTENLTIFGCHVRDSGSGIRLENVFRVKIDEADLSDNQVGMSVVTSRNVRVWGTEFVGNALCGVRASRSEVFSLKDGCLVADNGDLGIDLDDVSEVTISRSRAEGGSDAVVRLSGCNDVRLARSHFEATSDGLLFSGPTDVLVEDCTMSNAAGAAVNVSSSSARVIIEGCHIEHCAVGISLSDGRATVINGSIEGSGSKDLVAMSGARMTTVNLTFDGDMVSCSASSEILVLNHLWVLAEDQYGDPVEGVEVEVTDGDSVEYASAGYGGTDPPTGPDGAIRPLTMVDRIYMGSPSATENSTVLRGSADGTEIVRDINMSTSHVETLAYTINDPPNLTIVRPKTGQQVDGVFRVRGEAFDPDAKDAIEIVEVAVGDRGVVPEEGDWEEAEDRSDDGSWSMWRYLWNTTELEDGDYSVWARASDGTETCAAKGVNVSVVHQDLPEVRIGRPSEGETVNGTITVEGSAWDEDHTDDVDSVRVAVKRTGEAPKASDWEEAADTSGVDEAFSSWEFEWATTEWVDGNYTFHAIAESTSSDLSRVWRVNVTIENDNDVPAVVIDRPEENDDVNGTVIMGGWVIDTDDGIESVECAIDNATFEEGLVEVEFVKVAWDRTNWSASWNTTGLHYGSYVVYVRATDGRGAVSATRAVGVEIPNVPPAMDFLVLTDSDVTMVRRTHASFEIEWEDSDPDDNARISLLLDTDTQLGNGNETEEVPVAVDLCEGRGPDGEEVDRFTLALADVPKGVFHLCGIIDDGETQVVVHSVHRLILVAPPRYRPPEIGFLSPDAGSEVNGMVTATGWASDDGAVALVEFCTDGGPWAACEDLSGDGSWDRWSFDVDTTTLADGDAVLFARATDDDGNVTAISVNVSVSNAPLPPQGERPNVAIATPAEDDGPFALELAVGGTSTDPDGTVVRVEVAVGDASFVDPSFANGTTSWIVILDISSLDVGDHIVFVRAVDDSGLFSAVEAVSVVVDNRRPRAGIRSITVADGDAGPVVSFRGRTWDGDIVVHEWISDIDGPIGSAGSFEIAVGSLTPGVHTITYRVQARNGLWSEPATETFVVPGGNGEGDLDLLMVIVGVICLLIIMGVMLVLRRRQGRAGLSSEEGGEEIGNGERSDAEVPQAPAAEGPGDSSSSGTGEVSSDGDGETEGMEGFDIRIIDE